MRAKTYVRFHLGVVLICLVAAAASLVLCVPLPVSAQTRAAAPQELMTSPKDPAPEYGHGLTVEEADSGWISLFDGQTIFGWKDAHIEDGSLGGGQTTSKFSAGLLRADVVGGGQMVIGDRAVDAAQGQFSYRIEGPAPVSIRLSPTLRLRTLAFHPLDLRSAFNGHDLTGWTVLSRRRLPPDQQTKWRVADGAIHALGGPGALELDGLYGDLVLQVRVRTRAALVNGGVFFRAIPGDFLNGYEAQVFNACYAGDPGRPARYSTGALDDRQLARRLVSRDQQPFMLTVIAVGPQIATWVNGCQMTDWVDTRPPHDNARQGLRMLPGAIQLQAHDAGSDLEFSEIRVAQIPGPPQALDQRD